MVDLLRYKRLLILFFLSAAVFVGGFIVYDLVYVPKVPVQTNNNLQAFPRVQPKDLPDANIALSTCLTDLKMCASDLDCESCDDAGKFKCVQVQRDGQYEINGIKVPKGGYCLPRTDTAKKCNRYTGKWVWTTASDCPPDENGVFSSQCWKCVCLYPDLFYDEQDCSTQVACINTSDKTLQSPNTQRKRNRLRGAPYAEYAGQYWDPNAVDASVNAALDANPYATDAKGRPKFYCECDARDQRNQTEFVRLPNDPYTCHVDMCYNVGQKLGSTYGCRNAAGKECDPYETPEDCTCSCRCSLNSNTTRPDGTCQVVAGMCDPGVINATYTGCDCGFFQKEVCRSNQKNQSNTALPACKDPENPFGEQCKNPCAGNPCGALGTCFISNASPTGAFCQCSVRPVDRDAENQEMNWSKETLSCASDEICAYGNTLKYNKAGEQETVLCTYSPGDFGAADDCDFRRRLALTPGVEVDKRSSFNCCIRGKYMYEWDNSLTKFDSARLRCLRADEKDLAVGQVFGDRNKGSKVVDDKNLAFTCQDRNSYAGNRCYQSCCSVPVGL